MYTDVIQKKSLYHSFYCIHIQEYPKYPVSCDTANVKYPHTPRFLTYNAGGTRASVVLHLLDGMGQIQGATTSATTCELSKTPITYDIPHREGRCPTSRKLILSGRRLPLDCHRQSYRQRDWAAEGVTSQRRVTCMGRGSHLGIRPSVRPSIRPSVHPSVRPSVHPSIRPSVRVRPGRSGSVRPVRAGPSGSVRPGPSPSVRPSVRVHPPSFSDFIRKLR